MASVSWVMSAAAPARSGLINPAGLPGPEIQEEPLLAGYVTFCIDFCHISFIIESIGHPSFSPEKDLKGKNIVEGTATELKPDEEEERGSRR